MKAKRGEGKGVYDGRGTAKEGKEVKRGQEKGKHGDRGGGVS
jgi:hypothetical protein